MKFTGILFTALIVLQFSCSKSSTDDTVTAPQPLAASNMTDVAYGTDPAQKMDIYLPAGRTVADTKVAIFVHGGAWIAGDKADMNTYIAMFQARMPGYAVFNINYRLATFSGANLFPTQENDLKSAVNFIYNKIAEYHVSAKFVLVGASAGGQMVLLQAYKNSTPQIKAVVDFFGPTDMADMYNNPAPSSPASGIALLMSGTPVSNPLLYASSSPINYVTAQSPPTILLHGGADNTVRYQQSDALNLKLGLNGVTKQYVFYPTEGHGWGDPNITDSYNKVQAFLNAYVQ